VKGSRARKLIFIECVVQVRGIDTKVNLRLAIPTIWNSTFLMLESGLKYHWAFGCFTIRDRNFKHFSTIDEWKKDERMWEFLRPFYKITNLISDTYYPTSDEYLMKVWKIEWLLTNTLRSDDPLMKEWQKGWWINLTSIRVNITIHSIAMILGPQMKLEALWFYY